MALNLSGWTALFQRFLPLVPSPVKDLVVKGIMNFAGKAAADEAAPIYARARVKMIDAVAGAAGRHLAPEDAKTFILAYVRTVASQEQELAAALEAYAPLALAVTLAEQAHPKAKPSDPDDPAVIQVRAARKAFLATVRKDVADLFEAIAQGAGAAV